MSAQGAVQKFARHNAEFYPKYPYIYKMLQIAMLNHIFKRNDIVTTAELRENGLTKGQISYASKILHELGAVKKRNARMGVTDFKRAKQVMDDEIWIMD